MKHCGKSWCLMTNSEVILQVHAGLGERQLPNVVIVQPCNKYHCALAQFVFATTEESLEFNVLFSKRPCIINVPEIANKKYINRRVSENFIVTCAILVPWGRFI